MIKRIIFLVGVRFNFRDYQRFGIEILQQNGFSVEVWDMASVLYPKFAKNYTPPDIFSYNGLILFKDELELCNKISKLSNTDFVINLVAYLFSNMKVHRALSKSHANYAIFYTNLPEPIVEKIGLSFLSYNLKRLTSFRRLDRCKRLFMKFPFLWLGMKAASLAIAVGENSINNGYPVDKNTEVLWIHTLDYDLYLKEKDVPCFEKPIAVFLEDYFPSDPEPVMLCSKFPFDPDNYYETLNNFFNIIEEKTGLEMVIGGHPRCACENTSDYFKGRKYIRGKTINLVKECQLVLTHCSTAVNFANLFYKPVIFMAYSDLDKTYEYYWAREMARWFGKRPVFIDKDNNFDPKKELIVNKRQYDIYRQAYIKTEHSEDLPFWQVVANRLKTWKSI